MEGSGNGPNSPKVHSSSNSDDCNDVNDTAYPFSTIHPIQQIHSDSTESKFEDHCYYRRSGSNLPYWIQRHENGGKGDNNAKKNEKNGDDSLKSSENGYDDLSDGSDYTKDLGFDDDSVHVDDKVDDKGDKKDENKADENKVESEVKDEGNNDGEDNNEVLQRHPIIRFLERSTLFMRNIINRTFDLKPPTPRQ